MNIHGGSPKTDGYKEEHAAGLIGCTTGNSLPLLEERLVLRVHGLRVDRHHDRQPLQGDAGDGQPAVFQPAHRRGRALGRGQRRARPALHLVPRAPGGRRAVRQRDRADPGRGAGLRHADGAGEPALRRLQQPAGDRHQQGAGGAGAQEEPDRLPAGRHRRREAGAGHGFGARPPAGRPGRRLARGREGQQRGDRRAGREPAGGGGGPSRPARRGRARRATAPRS